MKKSDLKQLIKPLVKECIHEVLLEEGLLSTVVSEVARGLSTAPLVEQQSTRAQAPIPDPRHNLASASEARQKILEHKQMLMKAVNQGAYNGVDLFEGTQPFDAHEAAEAQPGSTDLGSPRDPGVDISSLVGNASQIFRAMK
jgi:hypothetical protein